MDKYEYNLRNEEINALIGRREFQKAAAIADTIDWTKVRSVKTLCKISDLYKINRRYKESKILLEQALERCPTGKSIVSSLCELCIKMNDVVGAMEYYKLFVQMAPTDNIKFILLYKIYESEEATLDERIEVLEELKKRERIEKWCYELAYLYHRIGLTTRCVEECDDLILWFREGKYVKKAMELKMLHQQLTQSQENLYQNMLDPKERMERLDQIAVHEAEEEKVVVDEIPEPDPEDVLVKTVDVGQYSTINIQKALEESIKDALGSESTPESTVTIEEGEDSTIFMPDNIQEIPIAEDKDPVAEAILAPLLQDTGEMQELFVDMETGELELDDSVEDSSEAAEEEQVIEVENEEAIESVSESEVVAFPDMPVTGDTIIYNKGDIVNQVTAAVLGEEVVAEASVEEETAKPVAPAVDMSSASKEELMELIDRKVAEALANAMAGQSMTAAVQNKPDMAEDVPPRSMQRMLTQEYDGQISLVVPETEKLEKQITGQINIEEYLANWENTKKQNQQKHEEEIKKRLEQQTGNLFTEFEAKARDGILAKIELEDTESGKPIDADKEYEEYLKKIMAEDELPEVEELEEAPEEVEVLPVEEVPEDIPEIAVEEEIPEPAVEEAKDEEVTEPVVEEAEDEVVPESVAEEVDEEEVLESAVEEAEDEEIPESAADGDDEEEVSEPEDESADNNSERDDEPVTASGSREMTDEEMSLFSQFVQTKKAKENLTHALDSISLASYTGNVFVTGDTGEEPIELAKAVVQYIKMTDGNFSGKIGKVSGSLLNDKDVTSTVERLKNGGLIIEKASDMSDETVATLIKVLNQENLGILVVMQDTKNEMNKLFNHFDSMNQMFNVNIEIEELSDDALVAYGRKYAERMEYAIDEMGILALHTRIDEMQTSDHIVTVADVKDIVDEAIDHATRFSPKHITDVLFGKRYDDDDMIILKERDFIN